MSIIESITEAIVVCDEQARIIVWNAAAERLFGYRAREAIGRPYTLITPAGGSEPGGDFLIRLAAEGVGVRDVETERRRKDGSLISVQQSVTAIRGQHDRLLGFVTVARERQPVTERGAYEQVARYRTFFEETPAITYISLPSVHSPNHGALHLDRQLEALTGYRPETWSRDRELLGRIVHPDDRERLLRHKREAEESGAPFRADYRIVTATGQAVWVREAASLVRGADGEPCFWLGFIIDISEEKRAEAALASSESKYRAAFDNAPIGMAVVGLDLHIVQANRALCALLGFAEDELVGKSILYITHPDDLARNLAEAERALRGEIDSYQLEKRYIRKDGQMVWGLLGVSLVSDEAGAPTYLLAHVQDITERKVTEIEREAAHQKIWDVLDRITDGFVSLDRSWCFTYLNRTAERLLGRSRDDLLGANIWEAFPFVRETAIYPAALRAMTEGVTTDYSLLYEPTESWHDGRIYPSPGGVTIFIRDVSEQRRAEAATAEALSQLQQANRELAQLNYAKSDFVSTISHEFRTPLTSIQGYSELLLEEELPPDQARAFAATIHESAIRLTRMISNVLDLDRMEAGRAEIRFDWVDLTRIIESVVSTLRPTAPRHRFVFQLDPNLPLTWCDPDLINRVITNLVANAIKYAPMGGDIVVQAAPVNGKVRLTVSDQGLGVPIEFRESIFTRYGRIARPEQAAIEGTGLGLPIARHIVEMHRGRIWVESNSPRGSVFCVEIPISQT